jgi:O-antigen/teichoic acid export membrane protein
LTFEVFQRLRRRTTGIVRSYDTEAGRRALWNLVWSSLCTVLGQACGLCALLLLTGVLGPEKYGALAFALTLQWYMGLVGGIGAGSMVIRDGSQSPQDLDTITTSYFVITGLSSGCIIAVTLLGAAVAPVSAEEGWLLALFAVGNVAVAATPMPLFVVQHRQARGGLIAAVGETFGLAMILFLARSGFLTLPAVGMIYSVKWVAVAVVQFLVYHRTVRPLRWSYCTSHVRRLLHGSWPMMFVALVFYIPLNAGVVLVRTLEGDAEAGIYGIAYQAAGAYYGFAALGVQIVQPHITGPYGVERSFVRKLCLFAALFFGGLALFVGVGALLVIRVILNAAYQSAVIPMAFLVGCALVLLFANLAHIYLLRFQEQRFLLCVHLCEAGVYLGGGALLVARFGFPAAALWAVTTALLGTMACLARVRTRWPERGADASPGSSG